MRPSLPVPAISRRTRIVLIVIAVLIVGLSVLGSLVSLYIDWLWYGEVGYRSVFGTVVWTRILLFFLFRLLLAAVGGVNLGVAYRLRPRVPPLCAGRPTP